MQNQSQNLPEIHKISNQNSRYNLISYETRKTLIQMVQENGLSIYKSANILNMKHSTAKAIMRKYRRQGHIFIRKHEEQIVEMQHQQQNSSTLRQKNNQKRVKKRMVTIQTEEIALNIQENHQNLQILRNGYSYYWYMPIIWTTNNYYLT